MSDKDKENFGTRPFKRTTWKDLPPKPIDSFGARHESNPEELAEQLHGFMHGPKRKPDIIDAVTDEAIRTSLLTPEQKAREKRAQTLEAAGYVEVGDTVMKKEQAVELVREGEVEVADVFGLRKADVSMVDENDDGYGYLDEEEDEWEMDEDGFPA